MIVEEGEQVGFSAPDPRAVQRVTDPTLVGCTCLEPAEHRCCAGTRAAQLEAVEQAQQRGLRGRVATRGPQDPRDLRCGALGVLPLERGSQLQHPGVNPGPGLAGRGGQGLEAAGPVAAQPPVQGVTRIAVLPAERAGMGLGGDRADDPAPRLARQTPIQGGADHLVAEQRHLLRPCPAPDVVLVVCAHHENPCSSRETPAPGPAG